MGKGYSRPEQKQTDSSASYVNSQSEPTVQELPTVHREPIQSLCTAGEGYLLSGGVDKVCLCLLYTITAGCCSEPSLGLLLCHAEAK